MTTLTIKLPNLHPGQQIVEREARRFNVINCGRRWGKTKYCGRKLIEPALHGYPTAWFAPTNKMMAEVWREVVGRTQPLIKRSNASDHRIELITDGVIEMWSLENFESTRGRKYKRAVIDEAAMVQNLGEAWQAVIRPTLTDLKGDAFLPSTPKGRNFFWECFQRGLDPHQEDWACWQMPTSTNPYIDPLEIEAARRELPERIFQQEYLALFLENAGGVFRKVRAAATAERRDPYDGQFAMGVDWAQKHDFTVLTVIDVQTKRMVDWDRFNQIDWEVQRSRLQTLAAKWKAFRIVAEHNSIGGPNIEALQRMDLPVVAFEMTPSSKPPLIESLALAFEQDEITILNDPLLIGELEAYERTVSEHTGRSRYSAPEGQHDDTVISLALAWHAVQQPTSLLLW
jgi:hypothetical protein